jgi:hypothetical protein
LKAKKNTNQFDTFTSFMDKLAKVPHSELKADLDAEKEEKKRRGAAKIPATQGKQKQRDRGQQLS